MSCINIQEYSRSKQFFCCVTGEEIPTPRVECLLSFGIPESELTSLQGAQLTHKPRKIIVVDDIGTEYFCDKIDNTRAWEAERFGNAPDDEAVGVEGASPKTNDGLPFVGHETIEIYIKKQDMGEEEEQE